VEGHHFRTGFVVPVRVAQRGILHAEPDELDRAFRGGAVLLGGWCETRLRGELTGGRGRSWPIPQG
jgi:hypothetical protein